MSKVIDWGGRVVLTDSYDDPQILSNFSKHLGFDGTSTTLVRVDFEMRVKEDLLVVDVVTNSKNTITYLFQIMGSGDIHLATTPTFISNTKEFKRFVRMFIRPSQVPYDIGNPFNPQNS